MPHRNWQLRIADIIEAIETVLYYVTGMTYDRFTSDRKTIDAVLRNFIIIGEAAAHLPDDFTEMHPEVPWREMRDMRNITVHEYFGVDSLIVWETLQKDLPPLLPVLKRLFINADK